MPNTRMKDNPTKAIKLRPLMYIVTIRCKYCKVRWLGYSKQRKDIDDSICLRCVDINMTFPVPEKEDCNSDP